MPADEKLQFLAGDDPRTKQLNANFELLNGLLFGYQDYALVATR